MHNLPSLSCLKQTTAGIAVASLCLEAKSGIWARLYCSDLRWRSEERERALDFFVGMFAFSRNPFSLKCYNLKIRVEGQKEGGVERPAASDGSLGSFSPLCAVLFGAHMPGHALTCTVLFVFLTPWVPCSSKCLSTSESECEESVYAFLLMLEAFTPVGPVDLFHVFSVEYTVRV